jgi:twitching motility protein PilT
MAAVDSLLRMISTRNAESLSIVADGVPELRRGGTPAPLSMPPLSAAIVGNFVREIGGTGATAYQSDDGSHYEVAVEGAGSSVRITFTPVAIPARSQPTIAATPTTASNTNTDLASLLAMTASRGASDILLSSGVDAWLRVEGSMHAIPNTALSEEQILEALGVEAGALDATGSIDFAMESNGRYRVNVFRQCNGIAAALRPIRNDPPSLESLHLPASLRDLAEFRNGLVLIAGTAGSGKSTTLAALIEHLNTAHSRHVITLEDPIEYRYVNKRSLIHQREIGDQVPDFPTGLRSALRESPDVLLVGEMRDRETISAAITAAETGHLVLGTIHASCAMVAIDRIIDVFPEGQQRQIRYQLASILRATLTQMLVASPLPPGRMPAIELMRSSSAIAANIREDKTYQMQSAIQTGRRQGMITLELSLAGLVKSGRVRHAEAETIARDKALLGELLGGL